MSRQLSMLTPTVANSFSCQMSRLQRRRMCIQREAGLWVRLWPLTMGAVESLEGAPGCSSRWVAEWPSGRMAEWQSSDSGPERRAEQNGGRLTSGGGAFSSLSEETWWWWWLERPGRQSRRVSWWCWCWCVCDAQGAWKENLCVWSKGETRNADKGEGQEQELGQGGGGGPRNLKSRRKEQWGSRTRGRIWKKGRGGKARTRRRKESES